MARPISAQPTPAELEVLQILWTHGPQTVRQVMNRYDPARNRAYTTVMSLMNVMADKGLLTRSMRGRAFVYSANSSREKTVGSMVKDLVRRAFDGSTTALVAQLLDQSNPSEQEIAEIQRVIEQFQSREN